MKEKEEGLEDSLFLYHVLLVRERERAHPLMV